MSLFKPTRFNEADAHLAFEEWGCNCGPSAIAAICNLTLDEVRPFMGDFEEKKYTNPKLMMQTLTRLGVKFEAGLIGVQARTLGGRPPWPFYGLARVQWEGPWTEPTAHPKARYGYTHWVASCRGTKSTGIFDINAINNGSGWVSESDWASVIAPFIMSSVVKRGNGKWHLTHLIEVLSEPTIS